MQSGDGQRLDPAQNFQRVAGPAAAPPPPRAEGAPKLTAAAPPKTAGAASGLSAVVVVHGMGQQIPFETLDSVVEGLLRIDQPGGDGATRRSACNPVVRLSRIGGTDLPRAELDLHAGDGPPRRVHLYEAYWAPLTEGQVRLRDVLVFLGSGALNGLRNARKRGGFGRFIFGHPVPLKATESTPKDLRLAAFVLGSLIAINFVTSAIFASAVLQQTGSSWVSSAVVAECTLVVVAMLAGVALSLLLLFTTRAMAWFRVAMALIGLAGLALLVVLVAHARSTPPPWSGAAPGWASGPIVVGLVWTVLAVASWFVRGKLVQYVGDVAVYVTPQSLDRFAELRTKIKDVVSSVLCAVYRHGADGSAPAYERIAVVGHSLGSVAAYDALNAAINADQLDAAGAWHVVPRTCLLLTFGSPLDKTAFIFQAQGHDTGETREALAAAVQPLIQDYAYRSFPWVNVWSPADIVSGELEYYDDPQSPGYAEHRVENKADPDARTPLVAHTEYWKNALIFQQLHARLVG